MTVTVYGIPNCDQIRKTRRWLDELQIGFQEDALRAFLRLP